MRVVCVTDIALACRPDHVLVNPHMSLGENVSLCADVEDERCVDCGTAVEFRVHRAAGTACWHRFHRAINASCVCPKTTSLQAVLAACRIDASVPRSERQWDDDACARLSLAQSAYSDAPIVFIEDVFRFVRGDATFVASSVLQALSGRTVLIVARTDDNSGLTPSLLQQFVMAYGCFVGRCPDHPRCVTGLTM